MGTTTLRSIAALANAGRNFSEIPDRMASTLTSTRPLANWEVTMSNGKATRTASGTFSGANPSRAGSTSRRTARRPISTWPPVAAGIGAVTSSTGDLVGSGSGVEGRTTVLSAGTGAETGAEDGAETGLEPAGVGCTA